MKPCSCIGACSQQCRNDRAALKRADTLHAALVRSRNRRGARKRVTAARQNGRSAAVVTVNATNALANASKLKPSALAILGRLQKGPAQHIELMDVAGFRYSARIFELRRAGHVITVTAPGPTPGVRVYRLVIP